MFVASFGVRAIQGEKLRYFLTLGAGPLVAGNSNLKLVLVWTSSSVKGMSVLKSDYALGQHAVPVSLELA
jgi:hypothetical protein